MGSLILGVNTLYRLFCFFKLFPMVSKGLTRLVYSLEQSYMYCMVYTFKIIILYLGYITNMDSPEQKMMITHNNYYLCTLHKERRPG